VVENVFGRVLGGVAHDRPPWFFAAGLPQDLLPWSVLLPAVACAGWSIRREPDVERRRAWRLLLAWAFVTLVFFSLSSGKRGRYLLSSYPAWALLFADSLRWWVARAQGVPRPLAAGLGILAAAGLAGGFGLTLGLVDATGGADASRMLGVILIALLLAGAAAWRRVAATGRDASELAVAVSAAGAMFCAFQLVVPPALDARGYSLRTLAEAAAALADPGDAIAVFRDGAAAGGIAYYARRDVVHLEDAEQVRRFLDGGGNVVVAPASRFDALRALPALEPRLRFDDDDRDRDANDYVVASRDAAEPSSRSGAGEGGE
jgi:4-amino-4-deoxy-L-arabinose transferase-like glycosyltransferase